MNFNAVFDLKISFKCLRMKRDMNAGSRLSNVNMAKGAASAEFYTTQLEALSGQRAEETFFFSCMFLSMHITSCSTDVTGHVITHVTHSKPIICTQQA